MNNTISFKSAVELKTSLKNEGAAQLMNGKPFNYRGARITIVPMPDSRTGKPGPDSGIGIYTEASLWQRFVQFITRNHTPANEAELTEFKSSIHEWAKGLLEEPIDVVKAHESMSVAGGNSTSDATRNEKISDLKRSLALYIATTSLGQSATSLHAGARPEVYRALIAAAGDYPSADAGDQDKSTAVVRPLLSYCTKTHPLQMERLDALAAAGRVHLASIDATAKQLSVIADTEELADTRLAEIKSTLKQMVESATRIKACVFQLKQEIEDNELNVPNILNYIGVTFAKDLERKRVEILTQARTHIMKMCIAEIKDATRPDLSEEQSSGRVERASQLFDLSDSIVGGSAEILAIKRERAQVTAAYREFAVLRMPSVEDTTPEYHGT